MRQRVLVTGAAGAVGAEVVRELSRRPERWEVIAVDLPGRRARRRLAPFRRQARVIWADLRRRDQVSLLVEGVDAVVHLAALIPPRADREPVRAEAVNVGATRTLLEALERSGRAVRFLYASSISIYGDRLRAPWIRVGDALRPSPGDAYAETKIRAEALVRASTVRWSVLRLSAVIGPAMAMDPLMFHVPLATALEIVTPRDCGQAFARALEVEGLEGRVFNLGGGPRGRTTYRELLDGMMEVHGLGRGLLPEEAFAEGNFHCGWYADSDELERLVGFQREGLEELYAQMAEEMFPLERRLAAAARPLIRRALLSRSEPLRARRQGDLAALARFGLVASSSVGGAEAVLSGAEGGIEAPIWSVLTREAACDK